MSKKKNKAYAYIPREVTRWLEGAGREYYEDVGEEAWREMRYGYMGDGKKWRVIMEVKWEIFGDKFLKNKDEGSK